MDITNAPRTCGWERVIEDEESIEKARRLERLTQAFARVNSVLTLRHTKVKVASEPAMSAPAWSDSDTVTFNASHIGDLSDVRDLAWLKGLDLHEVAHILYTPRFGSNLPDWVRENDMWQAFNALEDMRIETLLVGRFPAIVPWMTATIVRFFVDNPESFKTSYAVLRGRRYLPVELRAESRKAWEKTDVLDELVDIIDAYRLLLFPRDSEVAKDLITRFHNLMPKAPKIDISTSDTTDVVTVGDGGGCGGIAVVSVHSHNDRPTNGVESSTSRPLKQKEQQQDLQNAIDVIELDEIIYIDERDDSDELDDNSGLDDESSDDSDSDSDGDSKSDSDSDSNDGDGNPDNSGTDAGIDSGTIKMLEDMLDDVLNDESISQELITLAQQISGDPVLTTVEGKQIENADYQHTAVDPHLLALASQFAKELQRIKSSVEPDWIRFRGRGRMDVWRVERGDDFKTVFDEYSEDLSDAVDIECVIALDVSGSMNGVEKDAYGSMYAIKRALDKIKANCTVLLFESESKVLYHAKDKATTHMRNAGVGGGTEPLDALKVANNILAESDRAVKIMFVISDGAWYNAEPSEELLRKMRTSGVLTAFAYIGDQLTTSHECEIAMRVGATSELLGIGRQLVKTAIARKLANR